MKKILVPTDFSKPAEVATQIAVDIASRTKAKVILLHVVEQPISESFNAEGEISNDENWEEKIFTLKMIELAKEKMATVAKEIESKGVKTIGAIRVGNAFHGIITSIADQDADLVVMGTSGRPVFEEIIVGSNTIKVIRHSHCPVLAVHERFKKSDFQNILYATSMSEEEKSFASVIKKTQEIYGSTIHLVRINTPMNFKPDTAVSTHLTSFAKRNNLKNYTVNVFNDFSEEEGIIHFAETINADLIGMATHGRTGFAHVIAGSITEDVVNHGKRPVLTFVTR